MIPQAARNVNKDETHFPGKQTYYVTQNRKTKITPLYFVFVRNFALFKGNSSRYYLPRPDHNVKIMQQGNNNENKVRAIRIAAKLETGNNGIIIYLKLISPGMELFFL